MLDQEADLAFVRSINDVGKIMGKSAIAEVVGNKPVLEKLREPTLKWLGLFELIQRIFQ